MAAEGVVRIILNAVDNYSGVLTGLNQGLELAGKAFSAINTVAKTAMSGVTAAVDVAAKGGAYQEVREQLENVAQSFGVNADAVIDSIERINLGMSTLPEAAQLAGRGIALGLREDQLETFFTFIKRRTELTGESFKGLSETVFTALASGRGKSLFASFGIATKAGDTLDSLLGKLKTATEAYGATSFNTADKLALLSAQQGNFITKIGQAINAAPSFQRILESVSGAVFDLVRSFDPRFLAGFFDYLFRSLESVYNAFAQNVPSIASFFTNAFSESGSSGERFAKGVINLFFDVYRTFGQVVNGALGLIQSINVGNIFSTGIDNLIQLMLFGANAITDIIKRVVSTAIEGWQEIVLLASETLRENPSISEFLGVSPEELMLLEQNMERAKRGLVKGGDAFQGILESVSRKSEEAFSGDLNSSLDAWKIDLSAVDREQKSIIDNIEAIKRATPTEQQTKAFVKPLAVQIEDLKTEETAARTAKKAADDAIKRAKQEEQAAARNRKDVIESLDQVFKSGELAQLSDELYEIETRLKTGLRGGIDLGEKELWSTSSLQKAADEIRSRIAFKTTLVDDSRAASFQQQVRDYLAAVNWPAELQSLGEFLLSFILLKARGENLPLAITTA